jgi:uncharacterized protein YndB with AHSA1/START domain
MSTEALVFERTYNAPIEKVWKALTDKNQMKQWYFDLKEFKAEEGFEFSFYGGRDGRQYLHKCLVLEVKPITRLSYSWRYDGYPGNSVVTFELTPESKSKTKLVLTHSGLDTLKDGHEDFAYDNFSEGWKFITGTSLLNFVETGYIHESIVIRAADAEVWRVLLNPNNNWANAFGTGTIAETAWLEGQPVIWKDEAGTVGARGIVVSVIENKVLEMKYYDEVEPAPGEEPGEYAERFEIRKNAADEVLLNAESGPLPKMYIVKHGDMWKKALELIKTVSEKDG